MKWDYFSDQPYQIQDRQFKKKMKQKNRFQILTTILLSIILLPLFAIRLIFPTKKKSIKLSDFFGIGINLDKGKEQLEILKELKLTNINIRFPVSEIDNIDKYIDFVSGFKEYKILITVLQNRENIENLELFQKNIYLIFEKFSEIGIVEFQIGNAINRSKWGFFSISEYLKFYQIAFQVRNQYFPNIKLIGSSVIDFEFYNTIHTLFNFKKIYFDSVSSLLYVDRRGQPENTQSIFFNLENKIKLLFQIVETSSKTSNSIYITETNYPISDTEPYTPTSQFETVSLTEYSNFMVRYFLISIATQKVEKVFWHQLISAGYGLIDNRGKSLKKYPAFQSLKILLETLENQKYISHKFQSNLHFIEFSNCYIYWTIADEVLMKFPQKRVINIFGEELLNQEIAISQTPILIII